MIHRTLLAAAVALTLAACASAPKGPTVMVLPGTGKPLEQFQGDDAACREWAARQLGGASDSSWMLQRRYDIAYQQCMYSRGHQIPGFSRATPPPPPGPGQRVPAPPPGAPTPPPDAPPPAPPRP